MPNSKSTLEYLKTRPQLLGIIREALGAKDENDTSFDDAIEHLSVMEICELWSQFEIGDSSWARQIIKIYEHAKKALED